MEQEMAEKTKGEILAEGLDRIRDGLQMVARIGSPTDLVRTLTGSQAAAQRLREVMRDNSILYGLALGMVKARNARLSGETVDKIVRDFLDVLFDLSRPYREAGPERGQTPAQGGQMN